nr:TPA_asm: m14.5 sORF 2 [Murid betaherpesvirus 1]DBA07926.1 TPA_asm: m14.5 sORF 2 [Murid betaherpesvirus 1]
MILDVSKYAPYDLGCRCFGGAPDPEYSSSVSEIEVMSGTDVEVLTVHVAYHMAGIHTGSS